MEKTVTVKNIIDFLTEHLDCTQKTISTLIGVNEATLSSNIEKEIAEVATKKTGKRLLALVGVVKYLVEQGLSHSAIMEILIIPAFKDHEGRSDSLKSIFMSEKYNLEFDMLMVVTQLAQKEYVARNHSRNASKLNLDSFFSNARKIKAAM